MHSFVHACVAFIKLHGAWAGPLMFIVTFGESFVGLSLLFPGTTVLVIAGTLVRWPFNPHGVLNVWPLLIGGILGAVCGDAISFWIGRRFGHYLERHWYFTRYPDFLPRGYRFFERYGVASVFVGRFFGPVRAAIPLVAGIMEMPWRQFWIANVGSALVWAPALLLVGTSFRVTLQALGVKHGEQLGVSAIAAIGVMILIWAARQYKWIDTVRRKWSKGRTPAQ
ncbi:MAG TPA: DedA family protein [Rhizomicrobium sp.]|jgi:membrane protein DedA with SNARE-associated domain|nr:DedA family protein [Rhizomicrobium sp.]